MSQGTAVHHSNPSGEQSLHYNKSELHYTGETPLHHSTSELHHRAFQHITVHHNTLQCIIRHHSAPQRSTTQYKTPRVSKETSRVSIGGLRSHVPVVVSRQPTSHMHPTHARVAGIRTDGHGVEMRTYVNQPPATRGSKPESERTHRSREKRDEKSKVPRKRVRNLRNLRRRIDIG